MTDLTFCYIHMTRHDLQTLDTLETPEYMKGDLSEDELDIPLHMVPPNPDDSDILPSQVHPSYPYGNPTSTKHPAARPRPPYDPSSRALFEDMGYGGGGVNGALRWRELALDELLPIDEVMEEARRAKLARKLANGTVHHNPQTAQQQAVEVVDELANDEGDEGDDEENDENDNDDDDNSEDDEDGYEEGEEEGEEEEEEEGEEEEEEEEEE